MNTVWRNLLTDVMNKGSEVSPRDQKSMELINHTIQIDMKQPIVTLKARNMG